MYNRLAHKAHCINGSCINLNEAYKLLNIKFIKGKLNLNWIKRNLPIEFSIFCHRGYHSVLCVKVENNKLQLTNYYRNRLYSISWDKLKKLQNKHVKPKQIKIK